MINSSPGKSVETKFLILINIFEKKVIASKFGVDHIERVWIEGRVEFAAAWVLRKSCVVGVVVVSSHQSPLFGPDEVTRSLAVDSVDDKDE